MLYFFDSSALAKRYLRETGSDKVNEVFASLAGNTVVVSSLSFSEIVSALNRGRNRGEITQTDVFVACAQLYADYYEKRIVLIDIHWDHIARANDIILQHNLRSHDAIILSCALDVQPFNPFFVVSDRRLLAAARERHFQVVNPEDAT